MQRRRHKEHDGWERPPAASSSAPEDYRTMVELKRLLYGVTAWLAVAATSVHAQDQPVSVSAVVDRSTITVGDVIRYSLTITHETGLEVDLPGPDADLSPFEVRDYQMQGPRTEDGRQRSELVYLLTAFETGELDIPSLKVGYSRPGDSETSVVESQPFRINIEPVKSDEAEDILDIKAPVEIPRNWWLLWPWVLAAAAALGALWLGYRRLEKGTVEREPLSVELKSPQEEAYEALHRLEQARLPEQGKIKLYYIEISGIIRRYVERRFLIEAMELTTTEVMQRLEGTALAPEPQQLFRSFFELCDLVKFAKHVPCLAVSRETMGLARRMVEVTCLPQSPIVNGPGAGVTPADPPGPNDHRAGASDAVSI